ncbi:MAG: Ig-like domain-containing protein [Bacteroidales bacterium]|nr:Ig-like domain-containing protein [Bacteroidales bacterium]
MVKSLFPFRNLILLFSLLFAAACANIVAPTGGPRDEDPPVVLRSTPPNYSTHYKGEDVRIFFDEFVELKNLRQNLLVSPPLEKDPEVRVRGRSIIMSIEDTLAPNTTYNFFFGESIVDITEGNPIPNFQFVASTGSYVDSLSVAGNVINALTLEPEAGVFVMMYDKIFDSVPMLKRPVYLSKTDKEGNFFIGNMREGEYLMFGLKDANSNYLYDSADEQIAFLDSLVRPQFAGRPEPTIAEADEAENQDEEILDEPLTEETDRLEIAPNDTLPVSDSLHLSESIVIPRYNLFLFQEKDTLQRLMSTTLTRKGRINFAFRSPTDSVHVRDYRNPLPVDWKIAEYNKTRDTLSLWFADPGRDSLFLEVFDRERLLDTVNISLTPRAVRGRGDPTQDDVPVLNVSTPTVTARKQPYYRKFELFTQTPLQQFVMDSVKAFVNDSIPFSVDFEFTDQARRRLQMTPVLKPDSSYRIQLLPGAMTDIFGASHDTLNYVFRTTTREDYGYIMVNIQLPLTITKDSIVTDTVAFFPDVDLIVDTVGLSISEAVLKADTIPDLIDDFPEEAEKTPEEMQYILQLLNEKWEVVAEKIITENKIYNFEHLPASTFRLRLVHDRNRNGKWDTGNYLDGVQPEKVSVFPDSVQSRLNWDVEVLWDLSNE